MPTRFACCGMDSVPTLAATGLYRGGDGLIREVELLTDMQVGILSDRRKAGRTDCQAANQESQAAMRFALEGKRRCLRQSARFTRRLAR